MRRGLVNVFVLLLVCKVRSIWRFTCGVYNLMKLFRAEFRVKPT